MWSTAPIFAAAASTLTTHQIDAIWILSVVSGVLAYFFAAYSRRVTGVSPWRLSPWLWAVIALLFPPSLIIEAVARLTTRPAPRSPEVPYGRSYFGAKNMQPGSPTNLPGTADGSQWAPQTGAAWEPPPPPPGAIPGSVPGSVSSGEPGQTSGPWQQQPPGPWQQQPPGPWQQQPPGPWQQQPQPQPVGPWPQPGTAVWPSESETAAANAPGANAAAANAPGANAPADGAPAAPPWPPPLGPEAFQSPSQSPPPYPYPGQTSQGQPSYPGQAPYPGRSPYPGQSPYPGETPTQAQMPDQGQATHGRATHEQYPPQPPYTGQSYAGQGQKPSNPAAPEGWIPGSAYGSSDQPPPLFGWYPDPTGRHEERYWDGRHWSDRVADNSVRSDDPLHPDPNTPSFDTAGGPGVTTGSGTAGPLRSSAPISYEPPAEGGTA
jgi:hypothetical protein